MDRTLIAWTDATWNPLRARRKDDAKVTGWHCEIVSEGCRNCYAQALNRRQLPNNGTGLEYKRSAEEQVEHYVDEKLLTQPLRWQRPRRIFLSSMTDVFGRWVSYDALDRLFAVMALTPQHTYQVLTKRPERAHEYLTGDIDDLVRRWQNAACPPGGVTESPCAAGVVSDAGFPLPNVWIGTSAEDQQTAFDRIPVLIETPAAKRFVSAEPLIGPIEFPLRWLSPFQEYDASIRRTPRVDWIIAGGESGAAARPCEIRWIRSIVEQCKTASVPVFVKQLGAVAGYVEPPAPIVTLPGGKTRAPRAPFARMPGFHRLPYKAKKGDDVAEWPEDLRVQEFPR